MKKVYGRYEVQDTTKEDGSWSGYVVKVIESTGKQGKLYIKSDGRENYQAKPVDDNSDKELEL